MYPKTECGIFERGPFRRTVAVHDFVAFSVNFAEGMHFQQGLKIKQNFKIKWK